jgi:enoyl-CoA hydratase/carnithine racemase
MSDLVFADITCEIADGIMQITLNRPDKLNAYTALMGRELTSAFEEADRNDDVRVVIVTGAGRAFCAGADISAGADAFDTTNPNAKSASFGDTTERSKGGGSFTEAIFNCSKPSIAAINGAAVGVGLTLTLPMDIRIAASDAKLGFVFARRGLVPEAASAWFLPRIVGISQALRWCLDGYIFTGEDALRGGLVIETAPADGVLAAARSIAASIAKNTAPVSVAMTRQMLWRMPDMARPFLWRC